MSNGILIKYLKLYFYFIIIFFSFPAISLESKDKGIDYLIKGENEKAYNILIKYAENGDSESQNFIGMMYLYGDYVNSDPEIAEKWLLKSSNQNNGWAQFNLANIYINSLLGLEI